MGGTDPKHRERGLRWSQAGVLSVSAGCRRTVFAMTTFPNGSETMVRGEEAEPGGKKRRCDLVCSAGEGELLHLGKGSQVFSQCKAFF